ncbi:MAG TPA: tail fiber protein [Candidatus Kapabacteria bacterium]|nr:tail fiber protein [Candidatus Kapabacteria bacterium]
MRHAFLGEVIAAAFSVVPHGWAACDGGLLNITDYPDLYQLLSTTYGGDGVTTFALPNLKGRVIVDGDSPTLPPGMSGGAATHALTTAEMPAHSHNVNTNNVSGALSNPSGLFLAASSDSSSVALYRPTSDGSTLNVATISTVGNGDPHENMQPYLVMNYFICISGGCYPVR